MRGTILSINTDGTTSTRLVHDPGVLIHLRAIVGGHIEIVPGWDRITWHGVEHGCVAFCNEEGKLKDLPVNEPATALWYHCLGRPTADYLCGNIAVVWGDAGFMRQL